MVGIEEEKTQHVNCAPWSSPLLDPGSFPRGVQKVIYCFLTCVVVVVVVLVVLVLVGVVVASVDISFQKVLLKEPQVLSRGC